jgi:hypothetical protein
LTACATAWETRAIERAQAEQASTPAVAPTHAATPTPTQAEPAVALAAALAHGRAVDRRRLAALGPRGMPALQAAVGNRALSRLVEGAQPARPVRPPTPGRRLLQRYSRTAAAAYARKWAMSDNPAYGRIEPNDCTNFVSQALLAGGWSMVGGSCSDRKDKDVWWFNPMECRWVGGRPWATEVKASFTWGGAQNLYWFMKESGRGAEVSDPMDLEIGDVLQMDMGAGHYNAGRIGHSMVVTGKSDTDLLLSYHEDHHLDEPLSAIKSRYPSARWYPWMPGGRPGDYPLPRGDSQAA